MDRRQEQKTMDRDKRGRWEQERVNGSRSDEWIEVMNG